MRLNLDIIRDHLPKDYQVERFGPEDRTRSLNRPLLYGVEIQPQPGRLYVAHADKLPKTPPVGTAWVCVGERISSQWIMAGIQMLHISNAPSLLTVYNAIQEIYDRFDTWDCQLRDQIEVYEGFNIKKIIELGARMLENHIGFADQFMQVIFSSEIIPQDDGYFTVAVSDVPLYAPLSTRADVKDICRLEQIITVPFISSLLWMNCRLYSYNLYPMGHYVGCVYVVERHRSFRESDFPLADHFFTYFQRGFIKYLQNFSQTESPSITAVRNLFNGVLLSPEESAQLSLQSGEKWVCFKLKELRNRKYMPKDYMYATINSLMPRTAYSVIHNDAVVGLLRIRSEDSNDSQGALEAFQEILGRMDYIGGLSCEFSDIRKFRNYYLQASYAVEMCAQSKSNQIINYFHDHILQYMLYTCTSELSLESLYSNGMLTLLDYDKRRNTDYVKTLDTYLKNEMSITRTADALYIHRSSLLKRLDKINQLIDADLNDPNVRLYFRICFRLQENMHDNAVTE